MAAAYVNGLQDNNVSATIKHFVGNDQEHERTGSDSVVSPRALREIYLRPFQIAQHLAKPGAYMSGYNKLNGTHCSENRWLLNDLLRKEWKHDGLIMSDWYGTYSVAGAINAGLDLEMPGPAIWRGMRQVNHLINAHKLDMPAIDARVRAVLRWVQTWAQRNTELVYSEDAEERTRDESKENDAKVLRKLAVEGIVLLKNDRNVLPIQQGKVAVIGPTAKTPLITGGGSAILRASWVVSPWQGLSDNCPSDVALSYAPGCIGTQFLPVLGEQFTCVDDMPGFNVYHYCIVNGRQEALPAISEVALSSDMPMEDLQDDRLTTQFCTEFKAIFTAPIDGQYEFGLAVTGQGRLWVDDKLVVDNSKDQERGDAFSGLATTEVRGRLEVCKGKVGGGAQLRADTSQQYSIRMLHDSRPPIVSQPALPFGAVGVRLGACPVVDHDCLIEEAVALAKTVDKAVIFCGLGPEWESEGFDRPTLSLPLRQNEMISRVSQANPNTVVVLQAGSAVTMPWNNDVAGIMQAWYGGNEAGNAIADIVYGRVNPSGRLPLTFPARDQDTAAFLNSKSARTAVHYEEGIWIGYKHHHARGIPPLFPFGHGLSYTTFEYSNIETAAPACGTTAQEWRVQVKAMITNTGESTGSHSVHFYTCPPPETRTGLKHPPHSLQAIANVTDLRPGESETVSVTLDKCTLKYSFWCFRC